MQESAKASKVWLNGILTTNPDHINCNRGQIARGRLFPAIVDRGGDFALQIAAADDAVDEAVLKQELACLKTLGQLDADRRFDRSRTGKADEGLGLGENHVAQRGE